VDEGLDRALVDGDDAAFLVHADRLIERGDPRGELIQIQHRLEAHPEDARLRDTERALIAAHAEQLLGPLAKQRVHWKLGYLERVAFQEADPAVVDEVMAHECARFLRRLEISAGRKAAPRVVLALAKHARPSLRSMRFLQGFHPVEDHITFGPTYQPEGDDHEHRLGDALWLAYPNLERLELKAFSLFHSISLPVLVELVLPWGVPACDLHLPKLERLTWELAFGTAITHEDIARFFTNVLPALRVLDLVGKTMDHTDEHARPNTFGALRAYSSVRTLVAQLDRLVLPREELSREQIARWLLEG
jgi:uncharacterized protein (TIGR02996 family)